MKRAYKVFAPLVLIIALTGCSSVKQQLGISRHSPDEFMVVKRAPLSLPPNYALRAPTEPNEMAPASEAAVTAQTVLTGKPAAPADKKPSKHDAAFMAKLGTDMADPAIRSHIDQDNGYVALQNRSVVDKLIFWEDQEDPGLEKVPNPVVDPKKEAKRLKQNEKEGKPLNTGNTPVIEKKKGTIDRIF